MQQNPSNLVEFSKEKPLFLLFLRNAYHKKHQRFPFADFLVSRLREPFLGKKAIFALFSTLSHFPLPIPNVALVAMQPI